MKLKHILISLCALTFFTACAAKPGVTPDSLPAEIDDELFSRAEMLFDSKAGFRGEVVDISDEVLVGVFGVDRFP